MTSAALNRAEFSIGDKVKYWNGEKLVSTVVTNLNLNPIDNVVEYRLFYREGSSTGKRSRVYVTATPFYIKESNHFKY